MSARCPEGHLSQDLDYCDQCGLRITSSQDSYGYRSDDRGAAVGSYGGGGSSRGGGGGYDPLGARHASDTGARGSARGGGGSAPYGGAPYGGDQYAGEQYGGGYSSGGGYDDRPPRTPYGQESYDQESYAAPRGRDAAEDRDPDGYTPPRGRDGRGAPDAGYQGRGRDAGDERDRDTYSPRGRDDGDAAYAPRASRDDYARDDYGRGDYGRDQFGRDADGEAYAPRGGRDDMAPERDRYGVRGGRDGAGAQGGDRGGYGYEADPLGVSDRSGERAERGRGERPAGAGRYPQCPNCRAFHEQGARFCENCGLDFTTGHMPGAGGGSQTGRRHTSPPVDDADYGQPVITGSAANWNGGGGAASATTWEAVVEAEREYYDSGDDHRVPFPSFYPRRVFPLSGPRLLVGRRSESRGIHPEIDLSGAPEDPGISRAHAVFERQPDGSYALQDPGSTNGTRLNDEPDPIEPHGRVPLQDGDRVYLGAWTRITVRAR